MSLGFVDSDNDSENIDIPDNMEATSINTSPTAKRLKVNDDNEDIIHEAVQIKNDEILAIELQQRLEEEAANDMMEESELENSKREGKHDGTIEEFTDQTSIIEHIEKKTDNSNQFFIVMRRKVSFNRVLSLWQREAKKSSPAQKLTVRYVGEDGIDTGALSREFLTDCMDNMRLVMFPGGLTHHTTSRMEVSTHADRWLL